MSKRITELKKLIQMAEARMDEARKGANGEPTRAYQEAIRDYRVLAKRLIALETAALIEEGLDDLKHGRVKEFKFLVKGMTPASQEEIKAGTKKVIEENAELLKALNKDGADEHQPIKLSDRDTAILIEAITNPPEPNEKLKNLFGGADEHEKDK